MSGSLSFSINQVYTLDQIRSVVAKLKMLTCKPASIGLIYLYREQGTSNYCVGGPFHGKDTHLFIYLGPKQSKSQFLSTLKDHFVEALAGLENAPGQGWLDDSDGLAGLFDFDFDFDFGDHT